MPTSPRILAVDDDEGILYTLKAIAEVAGWEATTASRPGEALGLLDAGVRFDVIVVDYHMPGMDGVALVRAIRRRDPSVPVVVLTVDERLALADMFREAGADDFAVKPIKAADFISRIRVHLTPPKRAAQALEPPSGQGGGAGSKVKEPAGPEARPELPKGLSLQTMDLVLEALRDASDGGWVGAGAIAARAGIAYQTVWRYLEALERDGRVEVSLDYGVRGRPPKRYRLRP